MYILPREEEFIGLQQFWIAIIATINGKPPKNQLKQVCTWRLNMMIKPKQLIEYLKGWIWRGGLFLGIPLPLWGRWEVSTIHAGQHPPTRFLLYLIKLIVIEVTNCVLCHNFRNTYFMFCYHALGTFVWRLDRLIVAPFWKLTFMLTAHPSTS